ncbi:ABC transporter permease [Sporosarcina sp. Marseille-Q4943]|uniref:ABC transporter permease n=1 Tax=Sporosarcina sp. Marseille-Q4943 TaxID=2942204 RepID=UPI00208DD15C|nr:ABC transporter permease [Sporosarcina sp. Marseille-Q4943]
MKSLLIAGKDVKILVKDRKALLMMIVMPIVLTAILGSALKGVMGGGGMPETVLGVYSNGANAWATSILRSLEDEALAITVEQASTEKQLHEWMEKGRVDVGVLIPSDWGDASGEGRAVILPAAGHESEATIIRQIFDTYAETADAVAVSTELLMTEAATISAAGGEVDMQSLHERIAESMQSIINEPRDYVEETSVGEQSVSAMQYYAAAMAAMFLLFNAMTGGKSFHKERQTETMARLIMTPTSVRSILIGKFIGTFLFAFFQFTIFMTVTHYLLKVDWGTNSLQTFFIAVCYCIAVSGLSMVMAVFTTDEKMADVVGSMGIQILALLGGSMLPLSVFPEVLRNIALLTPNSWALTGFTSVMSGTAWSALWLPAGTLLLIGGIATLVGSFRLKLHSL